MEPAFVSKLAVQLDRDKVRSKVWITRTGTRLGGATFARGALYDLLRNRLYLGEIRHRETWYPGEHEGIVGRGLWDRVQSQLNSKVVADNLLSFKKAVDASDSISLTIQAERKRFGGEVHLVVPPNSILAVGGS